MLKHWTVRCLNEYANKHTHKHYWQTTMAKIRVRHNNLNVVKCFITLRCASEKMGTQSGIASLCGFMAARVRAPRQKMTVPGSSCCQLINFISRPAGFPAPTWQLKLSKATSNKTCDSSFGECWHRQRYIVATR